MTAPTQVGRAMKELGVHMIPAYSPQAREVSFVWNTSSVRSNSAQCKDVRSALRTRSTGRCAGLAWLTKRLDNQSQSGKLSVLNKTSLCGREFRFPIDAVCFCVHPNSCHLLGPTFCGHIEHQSARCAVIDGPDLANETRTHPRHFTSRDRRQTRSLWPEPH